MIALGLAFGEKLLNAYAYDIKPSINKPATIDKIIHTFPEMSKFLITKDKVKNRPAEFFDMTRRVDYQFWYDWLDEQYESKFTTENFLKCVPDTLYMGPMPAYQYKGRFPIVPGLEVYLAVNTDNLEANPFNLY